MMQKLMEINDHLVRTLAERDELRKDQTKLQGICADGGRRITELQTELRKACAERDEAVEHAGRLQAELDATREQLRDVCSAKPAGSAGHDEVYKAVRRLSRLQIDDELVKAWEECDRLQAERNTLDKQLQELIMSQPDFGVERMPKKNKPESQLVKEILSAMDQEEADDAPTEPKKSKKPVKTPAGQSDLVRDVSHYTEAAEVDRPTEPQTEQDGVLVQEGWWLQADGNRVYVRPTNPTASNKGKIAQGYVWSDGARLYHSDGGHGDTPTPHDLAKFLGKHVKTQPAEPQQHPAEYTPPEGWRVLRYGELLQPGDQWVNWEGTESRPDILHGDGATVSGGRYIRQIEPEPQFKPYTFAAYIVGDKSQPDALRIVWATEEWIQHAKFGIVHRMRDMQFFSNDGGCNITEYHETLTLSLKIQ